MAKRRRTLSVLAVTTVVLVGACAPAATSSPAASSPAATTAASASPAASASASAGASASASASAAPSASASPAAAVPTVPTGYTELDQALDPSKPLNGKKVWLNAPVHHFLTSLGD